MKSQMTLRLVAAALCLMASTGAAQSPADTAGVRRAVLDYVEGFYEGDTAKLIRVLRPELYKYGFWRDTDTSTYRGMQMTYRQALDYARRVKSENRQAPPSAPKDVAILDVMDQVASARLTAQWGVDYLLLARYDGRWMITHVLWQGPRAQAAGGSAANLDAIMSRHHEAGQFNGSVLVAESGKVRYRKSFGLANFEWNIPNTPDTKFRVGSITKAFTAILVLQLVEQGTLTLDAKVSDYLPAFRGKAGAGITVHQLLTHTSGLPDYNNVSEFFSAVQSGLLSKEDIVRRIAAHDLLFAPGTKFGYSNDGYMLLGAIVEAVSRKSYAQVLRERILEPLHMNATGYSSRRALLPKRASGYRQRTEGVENAPFYEASPASGLFSTVDDLLRFDQALYGDRLLSQRSKDLMWSIVPSGNAYGWHVSRLPGDTLKVMSEGAVFGFFARFVRLPQTRQCIVLLTNVRGPTNFLPEIEHELLAALAAATYRSAPDSLGIPTGR